MRNFLGPPYSTAMTGKCNLHGDGTTGRRSVEALLQ